MTFNSLTYCSLFHATIIMAIGCNWHPWSNNNTKIPFKHFPIPYYFQTPFHHLHPIFHLGLTPYGPQHFFPLCSKVGIPQKILHQIVSTAGYVTFGQPSSNRSSSYDAHFSRPGISALGHDLAPHRSGSSIWLEIETVDLLDTRVSWRKDVGDCRWGVIFFFGGGGSWRVVFC